MKLSQGDRFYPPPPQCKIELKLTYLKSKLVKDKYAAKYVIIKVRYLVEILCKFYILCNIPVEMVLVSYSLNQTKGWVLTWLTITEPSTIFLTAIIVIATV